MNVINVHGEKVKMACPI